MFFLQVVVAIQNMAHQHHDFELQLRDAERLRLFVQSRLSDQEALDASWKEANILPNVGSWKPKRLRKGSPGRGGEGRRPGMKQLWPD